jgi:hypothetical protein
MLKSRKKFDANFGFPPTADLIFPDPTILLGMSLESIEIGSIDSISVSNMSGPGFSVNGTSKGMEIRFVKGKYAGLSGWIDKSKKTKKGSFFRHVIVQLEHDDDDDGHISVEELATRVKLSSFRKKWAAQPTSFVEAIYMQHPDIERAMIELAEMFAQTSMADTDEVLLVFESELEIAKKYQIKQGSKARYRFVDFERTSAQI